MYVILLRHDVPAPARAIGDEVAEILGMTKPDAKILLRRGRGILLENLEEEAARRIVSRLEAEGVQARAIAQTDLLPLARPARATRIERGEHGFTYGSAGGEEGLVAWEGISVVSCGLVARGPAGALPYRSMPDLRAIDRADDREVVQENLILKLEGATRGAVRRRDASKTVFEHLEEEMSDRVRVYLDLLTEGGGLWLRLRMDDLTFQPSSKGVRLGSCWAMDGLMKDLRTRAAPSFTDLTLDILAADDPSPWLLGQIEELDRYTAWSAYRKHLGWEPEIPWAELA